MSVISIREEDFNDEVIQSDKLTVVDFYAEWCGPCKMISPVLESISNTETNVKFCKINVDEARSLAVKYNISSIPAIIIFKDGEVVKQVVGFRTENELRTLIGEIK